MLLVDSCLGNGFFLDLRESTEKGLTKFRGKFQEAETENKNRRVYPFSILDENVKRLKQVVESRGLIGELDHPTDSIVHFANASHLITKLWWDGNVMMGEGEILNTHAGKCLKALINDGVRVGISSRGVGSGRTNENGVLVIGESYKLITFDVVADPSCNNAFQERVVDARKTENYYDSRQLVEKPTSYSTKNEARSIPTLSKDLAIACLGGLIKQKTTNMIARI